MAEILEILMSRFTIIDDYSHIEHARDVSPDKDDAIYFAIALLKECPIWSNDKALKSQNEVRIYNTKEILESLQLEETGE